MEIAIISSKKDAASTNIKNQLIGDNDVGTGSFFKKTKEVFDNNPVYSYKKYKLYTINNESVHRENIDREIRADFFIFISKHESKAAIPTLSVHSIGNWNDNQVGGEKQKLVMAFAVVLRNAFILLNEFGKDLGYEIVYEATHHGPYLEKPTFFIEIGSTIKEWQNSHAARIIADVIINLDIEDIKPLKSMETALGIGGLHTCPEFNKVILRNNNIAISHICPKYMLQNISREMIEEAMNKTTEKVNYVILDWKGLGSEKQRIIEMLDEMKISYKKTTSLY